MPQSSSIIFHCIICFESFDCDKKYPVCLPCGHTYICNECASRIDKCYECRTNLFYYVEDENTTQTNVAANTNDRYTRSYVYRNNNNNNNNNRRQIHNNVTKPKQKVKKRLPLPKNLVLCSLIESNNNASTIEKQSIRVLHGNSNDILDKEFDLELRAIVDSNTCGTYIVTNQEGVVVYNTKAKSKSSSKSLTSLSSSDNSSSSSSGLYESIGSNSKIWSSIKVKKSKNKKTHKLKYGDKIQIVSIDNDDSNYAILARRYGYVSTQHIKRISGPLDKVCRIEGILYNLFIHWKSIEHQKTSISKLKKSLIKEFKLLNSDSNVKDLTIIPVSDSMKELLVSNASNNNPADDEDDVLNTNTTATTTTNTSSTNEMNQPITQERRVDSNSTSRQRQQKSNSIQRTGRSGHSGLNLRPSSSTLSNGSIRRNNTSYSSSTGGSTAMHAEVIKPSASKEIVSRNNGWKNIGCNFNMCYS